MDSTSQAPATDAVPLAGPDARETHKTMSARILRHTGVTQGWHDHLALAILCLLCTGMALATLSATSGLGPDSVTYLHMADSIVAGQGLTHRWAYWDPVYETCDLPTPTTLWPPGYSMAIAALSSLGIQPYLAARIISILAFALLPVPIFGTLRLFLTPAKAILSAVLVMSLFPIARRSASVVSEPAFLLAATFSLYLSVRAVMGSDTRKIAWCWFGASLAAGVAILFRYIGISCLVSIALISFFATRSEPVRSRWLFRLLATVPAGLIMLVLMLRNLFVVGTPGQSMPGADIFWLTLSGAVRSAVTSLIGWRALLGPGAPILFRSIHLALFGILAVLAGVSFWSGLRPKKGTENLRRQQIASRIMITFVATYLLVLITALAKNGMKLNPRYVTIIAPWCMLLLVPWALRMDHARLRTFLGHHAGRVSLVVCALLVMSQGALMLRWLRSSPHESYVWATQESPTIAWIRKNVAPEETILSNRGAAIAYWCPNPVLRVPLIPFSVVTTTTWEQIDRLADKAHARFLVHWPGYPKTSKYDHNQFVFLRSLDDPSKLQHRSSMPLADGTIYFVGKHRKIGFPVETAERNQLFQNLNNNDQIIFPGAGLVDRGQNAHGPGALTAHKMETPARFQ